MKYLKLSALIILTTFSLTAISQTKPNTAANGVRLSIGADIGVRVTNVYNRNVLVAGAVVQAALPVADNLWATFNTGYTNVIGRSANIADAGTVQRSVNLIPVTAGLKCFATNRFYIQGEVGAGLILNSKSIGYSKLAAFIYAPQIGVLLPLAGSTGNIDVGIRYQGSSSYTTYAGSTINFTALRVAYSF